MRPPGETSLNAATGQDAIRHGWTRRRASNAYVAAAAVCATAITLWLISGVRVGEIARFVPYEIGFVLVPGLAVYRAVFSSPGSRLRQIVLGWSLGYLLEIGAFCATAAIGSRSLFNVYPVVVGVPALTAAAVRRRRARTPKSVERIAPLWIGALLCVCLLGYAAAVGFTQTPLPRDVESVTYQEDTPFAISLAAEALHHWPMTQPAVSGEPLHYHLFAFIHMAAVSQVTGIDLSVVVMRLYEVPLLILFALQLVLVGSCVARSRCGGLLAAFVVLFLGELDAATGTQVGRFLFRDFFFYWLLASHTFLLGLVFFLPVILLLAERIASSPGAPRRRPADWLLIVAFLVGCVGAKSYSIVPLAGGLVLLQLWTVWRTRSLNRAALGGLALVAFVYVTANALVFRWSSGGTHVHPLKTVEDAGGVEELATYFQPLWGTSDVPAALGVAYGVFGLLGIPILGIALLLRYRKPTLAIPEVWLLAVFLTALPPLLLTYQTGFGQMFLVFYAVVPGAILAASGLRLFWLHDARPALRSGFALAVVTAIVVFAFDRWVGSSARVGVQLLAFCVALAAAVGVVTARWSRRLGLRVAIAVGLGTVAVLETPLLRVARSGTGWAATLTALACVGVASFFVLRRRSLRNALVVGVVGGSALLAGLNTPLDWFPQLVRRSLDGQQLYDTQYTGLTTGLYAGLRWIRESTPTNAVLVVNNHSIHPDQSDSKYFYYSAFAERRVVLESWDYTPQTAKSGAFSLDRAHTPFPERLALSDAVFGAAQRHAARVLVRKYGADYLVADKVHGPASTRLAALAGTVFSNDDVDIYRLGSPGRRAPPPSCASEQGAGIAAVLGHRRTPEAAMTLRRSAQFAGFAGLVVQRRGCRDYAVVLTGLRDLAQAEEFKREAATVNFDVTIECRTQPVLGGLNAVFGHRPTKRAAEQLAARAGSVGFLGLVVQQDDCADWEVDLPGLKTAAQRREFRRQAGRVGFRILFEPG